MKKKMKERRWKSAKDGFSDRRNKNSNRMVAKFSGVPTGIRTPVPTVKGLCPRPLDDGDLDFGAGNEARTRDINLGKVALYQLSYSRVRRNILRIFLSFAILSQK